MYLDTSVVVPLYWPEDLSEQVEAVVAGQSSILISNLVEVEFASALSRRVRVGEIRASVAAAVHARFKADVELHHFTLKELTVLDYRQARDWVGRFDSALRSLDALHLAVAAGVGRPILTADTKLAASAHQLQIPCQLIEANAG